MCPTSHGSLTLCLSICLIVLQTSFVWTQKTITYQMEDHCNSVNTKLAYGERAFLRIGGLSAAKPTPNLCVITITTDPKFYMQVDVNILRCTDQSVMVRVQYDGGTPLYACANNPSSTSLTVRGNQVTVGLQKELTAWEYSMEVVIKPIEVPFNPDSTESNPVSAGLVAGIVSSIFVALILVAIICVCCHKRAQKLKKSAMFNSEIKQPLDERDAISSHVGYHGPGSGNDSSPRSRTKLLAGNASSRSSDSRTGSERPQILNVKNVGRPEVREMESSPIKSREFNYRDEDDKDPYDVMEGDEREAKPKSPFMTALHSNAKFRKTFENTEREAEERRKRISYSSADKSQDSQTSGEITPPPLPAVPVSRSPISKKKNHASIRRAPRAASSSSEDPVGRSGDDTDDPNIRIIQDSNDSPSSTEMIPVKINNPTPSKPDTRHTLRPSRGKNTPQQPTPETKSKGKNIKDLEVETPPLRKTETAPSRLGQFQKYDDGIRSSKRSNKSPKVTARGLGHRRRGEDNSRPTTPTSMMHDDDLESLPPLERTTSKSSLYASRSSLYNRRRRKNSFGESIASYAPSYAHDDIDFYKRKSHEYSGDYRDYEDDDSDGYVQPISRQEKARMFRSLGDLEHDRREKSTTYTQTLRETATQTGKDELVVMSKKRVVQRRRRSKSLSAAGTQTKQEKEKNRKEMKEKESDGESVRKERKKKKVEDNDSDVDEKPKLKPKPKPRKSQSVSANTTKDSIESENKDRKKKRKKKSQTAHDDVIAGDTPQETETAQPQHPSEGTPQYMAPGQPYLPFGVQQGYLALQNGQMTQPFFGVHPQAYGIQPPSYPQSVPQAAQPQQYVAHLPGKPRKSNWELLCEMTDPNKAPPDDVTSMASSVFTNHLPANYVGYPSMPVGQPSPGLTSVVMMPQNPISVQPLPKGIKGEVTKMAVQPPESRVLATASEGDSESSFETGSETESESDKEVAIPSGHKLDHGSMGKSSWDALKEASDKQHKNSAGAKQSEKAEVDTSSKMFTVV